MITGCSTHNQRIERLWRDLHNCVVFYRLFYFLESHGMLEPTDPRCLYALEYVFLPRIINHAVDFFVEGWNNHGIKTAGGNSPRQLFTSGVLGLQHSGLVALDFMNNVDSIYGVDYEGPSPVEDEPVVVIPENTVNLTNETVKSRC